MTQFTEIYNRFLGKITDDMYVELTPEDTVKDLRNLLIEAIPGFEFPRKILSDYTIDQEIKPEDEVIDGDNATVTVNITVYDFYKSNANAEKYYNEHTDEFTTSNGTTIDIDSYTKYRLEEMLKMSDTVDYEIKIHLNKENDEWVIQNPDRETLEKIHGLYDYENE